MNKKILMLSVILIAIASLIAGCSKVSEQGDMTTSAGIIQGETMPSSSSEENKGGNAKDLKSLGITDPYLNPDVTLSNLTSEEDRSELSKDLKKAGIKESYIKDYIDYVNLYNETAPESVLDGWNTLDKINYDSLMR